MLYSIGPNDLAQSLGYPGQPDHPEVVKTMQEITRRIRQAGRTMQPDVMQGTWVSDMLLGGVSPATLHRYKNRKYPSVADFG